MAKTVKPMFAHACSDARIAVRDSKNPGAGSLELAIPAWHDPLATLR